MSTQQNTQSIGSIIENAALTTSENLLPSLLAGLASGAAVNPVGAALTIAPLILKLVESGSMNETQLAQLIVSINGDVKSTQDQIDAYFKKINAKK